MKLIKPADRKIKRSFCFMIGSLAVIAIGSVLCIFFVQGLGIGKTPAKEKEVLNPEYAGNTLPEVNESTSQVTLDVDNFPASGDIRIIFLHHSTGGYIWDGGVPQLMEEYNSGHGTKYRITEMTYPSAKNGYPWQNYPYDYYNLWVKHTGNEQDKKELNLDQIAADYDVIIFKHCFPVSEIQADTGRPDINSQVKSLENYKLQYNALKDRMHQFPDKRFIVWTGASLAEDCTTPEMAQRAKEWANWVRSEWDVPGDNIFIWDFEQLETDGGLYMKYQADKQNSYPNNILSRMAAHDFVKRIVDVIEGRGDSEA